MIAPLLPKADVVFPECDPRPRGILATVLEQEFGISTEAGDDVQNRSHRRPCGSYCLRL